MEVKSDKDRMNTLFEQLTEDNRMLRVENESIKEYNNSLKLDLTKIKEQVSLIEELCLNKKNN